MTGLPGFDERWSDFPDYIIGITKEIWEDRGIATLKDYYGPDIPVRTPMGITVGNTAVIASTLATCHEFPDRQLYGEDVIWSGGGTRLLSSHRLLTTGTHLQDGQFGRATGKAFRIHVIADCAAAANTIDDEWLVRDYGGMVRQFGLDPAEFARDLVAREGGPEAAKRPFLPENDVPGPYTGTGNDSAWGQAYADSLSRIMAADVNHILSNWDRAAQGHYSGAHHAIGREAMARFWVALRSALPSATFTIHHRIGMKGGMMPPRAALRWSLDGTHDGWGAFGAPTGARIHVMGMSHAEFGPWGLRREWALYDEVAIWKQIHLAAG